MLSTRKSWNGRRLSIVLSTSLAAAALGVWSELAVAGPAPQEEIAFRGKAFGAFARQVNQELGEESSTLVWGAQSARVPGQNTYAPLVAVGGTKHNWNTPSITTMWGTNAVAREDLQIRSNLRDADTHVLLPAVRSFWTPQNGWNTSNATAQVDVVLHGRGRGSPSSNAINWNSSEHDVVLNWVPKGTTNAITDGTSNTILFGEQFPGGSEPFLANGNASWGQIGDYTGGKATLNFDSSWQR